MSEPLEVELAVEIVEQFLDFGVVVRARIESRRDGVFKQRAMFRILRCEQIVDAGLMQGDSTCVTVFEREPAVLRPLAEAWREVGLPK
jgi:hypothetical protein